MGLFKKKQTPKGYEQVQGSVVMSHPTRGEWIEIMADGQRIAELCKSKPIEI